jgi:transposase
VWLPDPQTRAMRRQVLRRAHIVRQPTRLNNQVHTIGHRKSGSALPAWTGIRC